MKKHMPRTPDTSPKHLLSCYGELTAALGRQGSRAWEDEPATASAQIARSVEDAIRALLPDLVPEHEVLKKALYSGSPRVLADVFEIHGVQAYHDIHFVKPISFSEPLKRANLTQLRMLHEAGFDLSGYVRAMLKQIRRHESPAYLSFLRDELGSEERFCDVIAPDQLLADVPAFLVPVVAQELRETLGTDALDPVSRGMVLTRQGLPLKHLALLVAVGRPLAPLMGRAMPHPDRDPLARIVRLGESAHGRLELHRLEPDFEAMVARPATAEFYGIDPQEGLRLTRAWYADARGSVL